MEALLTALQELAAYYLAAQSYKQALTCIQRALPLDRANEELYRQAMRAQAALGDGAGLAQTYEELKQVLARDLGIDPMPGTTELYLRLLERVGGN